MFPLKIMFGLVRNYELNGSLEVSDRQFRLCHNDVDVYQSGKDVLDWVAKYRQKGLTLVTNKIF